MDIQVEKAKLISALQILTPITDKSSTKPILSNFLMEVTNNGEGGMAQLTATDYEISTQVRMPVGVKEPGSICVSAKKMLEICREYLTEEIHISSDPRLWVAVEGGPARLDLPSVEIGLYPQMEMTDLPNRFKIATRGLARCIEMTIFACQASETRKNLMGVNLRLEEGKLAKWTATDGHRLSQITHPVEVLAGSAPEDIIIPRKALVEIQKVLEIAGDEVEISFDERSLVLAGDNIVLMTRLIEGKFPNVDPVIPKENDKQVVVNRERLINALRIVSVMSNEKIKPVKFSLEPDRMRLESEPAENGKVSDEIPITYQGDTFDIGFNARYLLDVMQVLGGTDTVHLALKGSLNPCLINVPDDAAFLSVVMPLRIEW
jgi:DNA polymerase-3 subunit beta